MNKNDPVVTQSILTNQLTILKDELLEAFRGYRDEILTRMDKDVSNYEQVKEDQTFMNGDIKIHEERITKLEQATQPR